jgi:hypothetical protein
VGKWQGGGGGGVCGDRERNLIWWAPIKKLKKGFGGFQTQLYSSANIGGP